MQDGVSFNARIVLLAGAFNVNTTFVVVQFSSLHRMSIVVTEVQAGRGARRDHVGECRSPSWLGRRGAVKFGTVSLQFHYRVPVRVPYS